MNVFISYCREFNSHKNWATKLANDLNKIDDSFRIIIDENEETEIEDLFLYMEQCCILSDCVLVIGTRSYKDKSIDDKTCVGIETLYLRKRNFTEMQKGKASNIVLALREKDSSPEYLSGKTYIDFTSDDNYQESLHKLVLKLRKIRALINSNRPKRVFSERVNFTRDRDVIRAIYSNHEEIISSEVSKKRDRNSLIKYSLWKIEIPHIFHVLFLFDKISISKSLTNFSDFVSEKSINIESLIIIRVGQSLRQDSFKILKEKMPDTLINSYSLSEFVKKMIYTKDKSFEESRFVTKYYSPQMLYVKNDDQFEGIGPAASTLCDRIEEKENPIAYLILANGGDGKSELCGRIHNEINADDSSDKNSFLISTK